MAGNALLDKGGMPSPEQLDAMGADEATARGAQALILLSKEGSPEEQRAVKAMIDATSGEYAVADRPVTEAMPVAVGANIHASDGTDAVNDLAEGQMVNAGNIGVASNRDTGIDAKIYRLVDYVGTVTVNGEVRDVSRRVYQRRDIDFEYSESELGKSNLERMQAGKPPIGSDGDPIQLHHILQVEKGPMVEILEVTHKQYFSQLHGLIEKGDSFRNDPVLKNQYNNFRRNYWKWRANQILGGDQ